MIRVNEQSSAYLTVTFLDGNGAAALPQSVTYKVTDVSTGAVIRGSTAASLGTTTTILLNSTDTAMVNTSNSEENHAVTVTADYGSGDYARDEFIFTVVNLVGV